LANVDDPTNNTVISSSGKVTCAQILCKVLR
jgi:hypothetical protein